MPGVNDLEGDSRKPWPIAAIALFALALVATAYLGFRYSRGEPAFGLAGSGLGAATALTLVLALAIASATQFLQNRKRRRQ